MPCQRHVQHSCLMPVPCTLSLLLLRLLAPAVPAAPVPPVPRMPAVRKRSSGVQTDERGPPVALGRVPLYVTARGQHYHSTSVCGGGFGTAQTLRVMRPCAHCVG